MKQYIVPICSRLSFFLKMLKVITYNYLWLVLYFNLGVSIIEGCESMKGYIYFTVSKSSTQRLFSYLLILR